MTRDGSFQSPASPPGARRRPPAAVTRFPAGLTLRIARAYDHEAIVALDERSGADVAIARYVRDPARPNKADVAVTVVDDWQGLGLGTLLLDVISARARDEGISTALMLAQNREMRDLFERFGPVRVSDRESAAAEIKVTIPVVRVAPGLKKLLGIAARAGAGMPLPACHDSH
jgi:GNAT superfamily N-acetyltransferase